MNCVDSNAHTVTLVQSKFEIHPSDDAKIEYITSHGAKYEDLERDNYYVIIKIIVENTYAFYIKYNINKNKEFSSFDCSHDSLVFFDYYGDAYILDENSIIEIDQGIPLYFYKTGLKDLKKIPKHIDKG